MDVKLMMMMMMMNVTGGLFSTSGCWKTAVPHLNNHGKEVLR